MKMIIVAGTPGSGKTSVLTFVLKHILQKGMRPSAAKIDCLYTNDHLQFEKIGVPTIVGLSKDMCPDHFSIYNTEEMLEFANNNGSELLIVETAGLCHRCAPYTKNSLGVCVIDATTGPNTPRKVGPFLSTADIVAITKGDIISQAEREIFRERILEMNPNCRVIEVNGLSGKGAFELSELFLKSPELQLEKETLRHNAPFAICTLCVGETKVAKNVHRGLLRRFDGVLTYQGE